MNLRSATRTAAVSLLLGAAASAQSLEVSVQGMYPRFSGKLGSVLESGRKDDDTTLKGKNGIGVRLTANTKGYYGHELTYFQMNATFGTQVIPEGATARVLKEEKVKVRLAAYNFLMYMMPRGERFRPFITGGLQAHEYGAPKSIPEFTSGKTRN
jgi:hypothetical protein